MNTGRKYMEDVKVPSAMSEYSNCCCDMCFRLDHVIKLKMPSTRYHNGRTLSTLYSNIWICESCRDKLVKALDLEYPQTRKLGIENADD